jgi:hypothetical protein
MPRGMNGSQQPSFLASVRRCLIPTPLRSDFLCIMVGIGLGGNHKGRVVKIWGAGCKHFECFQFSFEPNTLNETQRPLIDNPKFGFDSGVWYRLPVNVNRQK